MAAVARVFTPGCKFDNVLTLPGPQGIGKSTFFKTISGKWFNDSFSFASGDKEKVETITNGWIIEISELNGLKRANDAEAAKAFLSRCSDYMRPAYGHKVVEFMRHNVFAATTNETNFLQGDNGNRRWWIIPVKGNGHVSEWLDALQRVVPQLWAEAYAYYRQGMKLYLTPDMEIQANEVQVQHSNILVDPIIEDLEMYLEREIPVQYASWTIPIRQAYQKGAYSEPNSTMTTLNMVCARQIIGEMPNDLVRRNPAKYTSQYINRLMSMIPNWKRSDQEKVKGLHPAYCDKTGRAKHPWVRVDAPNEEVCTSLPSEQELPF